MQSYQNLDIESVESGRKGAATPMHAIAVNDTKARLVVAFIGCLALVALIGLVSVGSNVASTNASLNAHMLAEESAVSTTAVLPAAHSMMLAEKNKDKDKSKEQLKEEETEAGKKDPMVVCQHPDYTKKTLKLATEHTMAALFKDLHGQKKFEASDVIRVGDDYLVVYDNLWEIGRINMDLAFHSSQHELVHSSKKQEGDSGFEAIVYDDKDKSFYVVIEAVTKQHFHAASIEHAGDADPPAKEDAEEYHAVIETLEFPTLHLKGEGDDAGKSTDSKGSKHEKYELKDSCPCDFKFKAENKGFEGMVGIRNHEDEFVMIGLCEGNFCEGGARGKEPGNGRLVLMRKVAGDDKHPCRWETLNILSLPSLAYFSDYSSIALRRVGDEPNLYNLAITSQESSQVWLGQLQVGEAKDFSDWNLTEGDVLHFPRSGSGCEIEYCNIEGVTFLDDNLLVAVSDKMKSGGRQPFRCFAKDQSIHTFILP